MISDEDIRKLFSSLLETPGGYKDPTREGNIVQIYRGMPGHLWKDAQLGGCERHKLVFDQFGVIPKYCFDCYKVEILPRTVVELLKLLMVFGKISLPNDNTRKCMVERRPDCSGAYKGFVYCRGMDEGKAVRKLVRNAISEEISPQTPVALKRGCSEYARAYPRYAQIKPGVAIMEYKKEWQSKEDMVDKRVVFETGVHEVNTSGTYPLSEINIVQYWLSYAATIGDMSYLAISGKTLAPVPHLKRPPFSVPLIKDGSPPNSL